jgi:hypothetical protein
MAAIAAHYEAYRRLPQSLNINDGLPIMDFGMAQEVTVMECSRVERIGPLTRLIFTIPTMIDPPGRVVVVKLLMPTEIVSAIAAQMTSTQKRLPPSGDEATLQ